MLRVSVTTSTSGITINDAYTETTIKDNDNGNLSSNKVYMLTSFVLIINMPSTTLDMFFNLNNTYFSQVKLWWNWKDQSTLY